MLVYPDNVNELTQDAQKYLQTKFYLLNKKEQLDRIKIIFMYQDYKKDTKKGC
jgi:hypothetical protein